MGAIEAVVALAAAGALAAVPIGAVALIVIGARHLGRRRIERFGRAAQALGLALHGTQDARGARGEVPVRVLLTTERRGSGKNQRTVSVTRYYAQIDPTLRMGLEVHEQTAFFGELLDFAGLSSDITIGDDALDRALRIRALDPDHARAILRHPELREPVLRACASGRFAISDVETFLQHDGWELEAGPLAMRLDALAAAARALGAARRHFRAGWEHALDAAWGGLAQTDGLGYDAMRSRLGGRVGDSTISIAVVTERGTLVTRASVALPEPLGIGLEVYRTGFAQNLGKLFGAQDVQVGVEAFDALFTVKATNVDAVRQILGGGAAQSIHALTELAQEVRADDRGVYVRVDRVVHDAREISALVRALTATARALRPGGQISVGAFR